MALSTALPCFARVFADLMAEDGLLVMGRGLGIRVILCRFILQYLTCKRPVFVLNVGDESQMVLDMLEADGLPRSRLPLQLGYHTHANERRKAYEKGGVIFTSSQVLLIDLLADRCDARLVEGTLVMYAERITADSKEGFALRSLKQKNPQAFIKGFSEDAETLTTGFGRIEKTLRALHINKLFLWPRFQSQLADDLSKPTEVVERSCDMSPSMVQIQRAIVDCMDTALNILRSHSRVDVDALTVDTALFDRFEDIARRQLGANEHALRPKARSALSDLRTLRKLAGHLLRLDSFSFYEYLETLRIAAMSDHSAPHHGQGGTGAGMGGGGGGAGGASTSATLRLPDWMASEAGQRIFQHARSRMYQIEEVAASSQAGHKGRIAAPAQSSQAAPGPALGVQCLLANDDPLIVVERVSGPAYSAHASSSSSSATNTSSLGFTPTKQYRLKAEPEVNPKWSELSLVLDDIRDAISFVQNSEAGKAGSVPSLTDPAYPGAAVLIAVKDERTATQLRALLAYGPQPILREKFARYLTKNGLRTQKVRASVLNSYAGMEAEGIKKRAVMYQQQKDGEPLASVAPAVSTEGIERDECGVPVPWYLQTGFLDLPTNIRHILLAADALGHDPTLFDAPAAVTGAGGVPSTVSALSRPRAIFIPAEQRLLWKSLGRMLARAFDEDKAAHAAIVASYLEQTRTLASKGDEAAEDVVDLEAGDVDVSARSGAAGSAAGADAEVTLAPEDADKEDEFNALMDALAETHGRVKARVLAAKLLGYSSKASGGQDAAVGAEALQGIGKKRKGADGHSVPSESQGQQQLAFMRSPGGSLRLNKRTRGDGAPGEGGGEDEVIELCASQPEGAATEGAGMAAVPVQAGLPFTSVPLVPGAQTHGQQAGQGRGGLHVSLASRLSITVYPLSRMDNRYPVLADLRPNFIVCYDLDPNFVREVEVYLATIAPKPTRLYTLAYTASAEEAKYLRATEREHQAFEKLIEEKAHLAVSAPKAGLEQVRMYSAPDSSLVIKKGAEGGTDSWGINLKPGGVDPRYTSSSGGIAGALNVLTGGAARGAAVGSGSAASLLLGPAGMGERARVIMDMRELRSRLPSLLDQAGIAIDPITIEVGDYILTPDICVERKSVPDLIGSLGSGRLYNQCEQMQRYYKIPVLLIEFDADKPFILVDNVDLASDIDARDVRSKLALLVLHFPTLRILWSRSPHTTVKLFMMLKKDQPQPDAQKAALAGTGDEDSTDIAGSAGTGVGTGQQTDTAKATAALQARESQNLQAIDVLRKLPGVTAGNYRALMSRVRSLAELAVTSESTLAEVLGSHNAGLLYRFMHERKVNAVL